MVRTPARAAADPPEQIMTTLAIFGGSLGWTEMVVIAVVALLLFGRRLPEVGRSLGKGIVEFKKGLKGIEDETNAAADAPDRPAPRQDYPAGRQDYAPSRPSMNTGEPARMDAPPPLRSTPVVNTPGATARRSDLVD
jgi:sec-independent protein translocase protein TatA